MKKVVLIGGYPKGYPVAFHINTKSGKILRGILEKIGAKPDLFNLWKDDKEEKSGIITTQTLLALNNYTQNNFKIIALGKYQFNILKKNNFECSYLPHPASRRKIDLQKLEDGLRTLD